MMKGTRCRSQSHLIDCIYGIFPIMPNNILLAVLQFLSLRVQFSICFYGCETEAELESSWVAMIEKFEFKAHSWLKRLFELQVKWCPALSMDIFQLG